MRNYIKHIKLLLWALPLLLAACDIETPREVCDYKVQLRYDYNEENTSQGVNKIEYYIYTMDEYIFREDGILFQHRTYTPDRCTEYLHSELNLPPGRYSVIAIGNKDERSTVTDAATGLVPEAGKTHRDHMRMTLDNAEVKPGATSGPSEKLYHGYRTFTVKEQGISRIRVDMVNAHLKITFRARWKTSAITPPRGDYHALLTTIPSEYTLMPQYIYPAGSFECEEHNCDSHDLYPSDCNDVIHHIPYTCRMEASGTPINELTYRHDTNINADWEMWGEFIAYRIKTETQPILLINDANGQSILPQNKVIDLQAYFEWYQYELDQTLKQEYMLDILIDDGSITVTPMKVGDWDEGGHL